MDVNRSGITAIMVVIPLVVTIGCHRQSKSSPDNAQPTPNSGAPSSVVPSIPPYPEKDIVTLRVPISASSFHYGATVIGDKYGFYKARGIKLKYVTVPPGTGPTIDALKKGEIDVFSGGTGHPDGFIDALLAGVKVKAVIGITKGHPNFPHDTAWVPIDSPIKEPKDIIGKRVGGIATSGWTQGCAAFYWSQYFKKHDISPDQVINAVVPPQQQEQALQQGSIDILTIDPPLTGLIATSGKYRQLWSSWDVAKGDVIEKQDADVSVAGFTEDYIQKNPDVVKRYVRATIQALAYVVDNHEAYIDWARTRTGWQPGIHDGGDFQIWSTGLVRPKGIQKWIDWKVELGQLKAGQLQPSDLYTNEFNPYAAYAMNDAEKNPTYWDSLPKEFLYLPIRK